MQMSDYYAELKVLHIGAVIASGSLFLLRGLAINTGARWPMAAPVRRLSYGIDSVLLATAFVLVTLLQQYPFVHAWLTVKVLLLVVYIALGIVAFWKARSRAAGVGAWLAALVVYGFIISVAQTHDPVGAFSGFVGS